MTPDRTAAAIAARRRATEQKLQQVRDAVASLRRRKTPVTYPAVARRRIAHLPLRKPRRSCPGQRRRQQGRQAEGTGPRQRR
jgi:hypothetical protein